MSGPESELHLHLSSGVSLAWTLEEATAAAVWDLVHTYWRNPGEVPAPHLLQFGEGPVIDSSVPLPHVVAIQCYPVAPPDPDQGESAANNIANADRPAETVGPDQ